MKHIRLLCWVRLHKISIFLLGVTVCVILGTVISRYLGQTNATSSSRNLQQIKVLILYSSGIPGAKVPRLSENIDAITLPTPRSVNTAVVAKMIAESLEKEMLQVTLKELSEIKKAQEMLFADVILIGSATHFSNMDWQTKRFFDETLYPFYIHHKTELKDKYIGCFTTSGGEYSGTHCIKAIQRALYDYGGKELPNLMILDNTSQNEVEKKVDRFSKQILTRVRER
jgi:flavodoxin